MSTGLLETKVSPVLPKRGRRSNAFADSNGAISSGLARARRDLSSYTESGLPATERLLTEGGDARIVCGPRGSNRYGCSSFPEPETLAYGSSTASTISRTGFNAAEALRARLKQAALTEPSRVTYERELDRVRRELKLLCGVEKLPGLDIIFGASGTDLHLFASQLMVENCATAPLIVRVEAAETGRGVPDALAGRHFSDCAALGDVVIPNVPLDCGRPIEILEVKCRTQAGHPRPLAEIDAEVEQAVWRAVAGGRRVLLTLVDVSKTGLLAPSPACVVALRHRFPEWIEVVVDACQFRLAPSTLKAYLEHDFIVAMTGSKFITGPTFCGALFVPEGAAQRLRDQTLPRALKSYSARADWPRHWTARAVLKNVANYGLLLRWEAALTELRAYCELSDAAIADFLESFAKAVAHHLTNDEAFEPLTAPALDRGPISPAASWDRFPTIFCFLLRHRSVSGRPTWLNQDETKRVHELLLSSRCQLGQPVSCGTREGIPVSALRLCVSSRLIVDALSPSGRGRKAVIAEALAVLDQAALLASLPLR